MFTPSIRREDCIIWTGAKIPDGYGIRRHQGRNQLAHRVAYMQEVGPIPEGLEMDHLCRNRLCINTAHLEPVTHRENVLRGIGPTAVNATKTHCPQGHPYAGDNLVFKPDGGRHCLICRRRNSRERTRRYRARKAAQA
jgi:hypothetical protein